MEVAGLVPSAVFADIAHRDLIGTQSLTHRFAREFSAMSAAYRTRDPSS
jgi:hypothetical protein